MGWSVTESLLCVAVDGSVSIYDIHGDFKRTLTMGQVQDNFLTRKCLIFFQNQAEIQMYVKYSTLSC